MAKPKYNAEDPKLDICTDFCRLPSLLLRTRLRTATARWPAGLDVQMPDLSACSRAFSRKRATRTLLDYNGELALNHFEFEFVKNILVGRVKFLQKSYEAVCTRVLCKTTVCFVSVLAAGSGATLVAD